MTNHKFILLHADSHGCRGGLPLRVINGRVTGGIELNGKWLLAAAGTCAIGFMIHKIFKAKRNRRNPRPGGGVQPDPEGGVQPNPEGGVQPNPDGVDLLEVGPLPQLPAPVAPPRTYSAQVYFTPTGEVAGIVLLPLPGTPTGGAAPGV